MRRCLSRASSRSRSRARSAFFRQFRGRIARAIRTVIKAATAKNAKPVFVEIQ